MKNPMGWPYDVFGCLLKWYFMRYDDKCDNAMGWPYVSFGYFGIRGCGNKGIG